MPVALFVLAHPDDEVYGPGGTIRELSRRMTTAALVLCAGNRPGAEHVMQDRRETCVNNLQTLGVHHIELRQHNDTKLEYHKALTDIGLVVDQLRPTMVFVHDQCNLHVDHRTANSAAMVVCRPTPQCSVNTLYTFENPGSTEWTFGDYGVFNPTTFIDITEHIDTKCELLGRYASETYPYPDCRSVDGMRIMAANRGKTVGMQYAEAFRLMYARGPLLP